MMDNAGILFITADDAYLSDARCAAKQAQSVMPELSIGIVTDSDDPGDVFDTVRELSEPAHGFADKVNAMKLSPFEKTLFLDTDTYLTRPVPELFELLDRFDLLAAHAPHRESASIDLPTAFPEFNTGVLAFSDTPAVKAFFDRWQNLYHNELSDIEADQPAFRRAVYDSDIRISTLPPEYNVRISSAGYLESPVAVVHGHRPDRESAARKFAETDGRRIHRPIGDRVWVHEFGSESTIDWVTFQIMDGGLSGLARGVLSVFKRYIKQ